MSKTVQNEPIELICQVIQKDVVKDDEWPFAVLMDEMTETSRQNQASVIILHVAVLPSRRHRPRQTAF